MKREKLRRKRILIDPVSLLSALLFALPVLQAFGQELDGTPVKAVDRDPAKDGFSVNARMGLAPFNAYHLGVTASISLKLDFTRTFGWEIVDGTYVIPIKKDLTTELADKYSVNPKRIETASWLAVSHLSYRPLFGKLLLFGDFVREFDFSLLFGGGLMQTSDRSLYGISYGAEARVRATPSVVLVTGVRSFFPIKNDAQHFTSFQSGLGLLL